MLKVALLCAGVAAQRCARVATDKSGLKKRPILSAVGGFYAGHVVVSQLGRRKSGALAALEFDIFERFAYPSMAAQSDDAFEWLVYAASGAPPRVLEGARRLLDGHAGFHLIVVDREACAAERRRTPEFWPLGDQLELLGAWDGLATRERDDLVLLTTRLEATDALPVDAVASIKDGAVRVPASFPGEAAAARLLCWASSRTLDLAGGGDVAEAAMAPGACARTGLTQVLTSQAIAKAKGSVFRFFPARARRKMWTVVLEGRRSSAPLAVVSSANGAPAPAAPAKPAALALPRLAAAYNVSTSARDLANLAARDETLRPAPCDLAGDCLAAIVLLSDADARGPTLAALRASFLDHVARERGKRARRARRQRLRPRPSSARFGRCLDERSSLRNGLGARMLRTGRARAARSRRGDVESPRSQVAHTAVFADSELPALGVEACCGGRDLGATLASAQLKLEHVYARAYARFRPEGVRYYVFSEHDVYWNRHALPRFLDAVAAQVPLNPDQLDAAAPVISGGGGNLGVRTSVYGCFAILNAEALRPLADDAVLKVCKAGLFVRNPWKEWVKPGALYNNDHLLTYCADPAEQDVPDRRAPEPGGPARVASRDDYKYEDTFWCNAPSAVASGNWRFHYNDKRYTLDSVLDAWSTADVVLDRAGNG